MQPQLVLASTSSYRKAQLTQLCSQFLCMAPDIDETPMPNETPEQLSMRLSVAKAQKVASLASNDVLIIGSDQCTSLDGEILGKPLHPDIAKQQLTNCSGQTLIFHSGLCVLNKKNGEYLASSIKTEVSFRNLSADEIDTYIKKEYVLDCAGSFKCEGLGISLFTKISSEDPSALIGLPLIQLNKFLLHFGCNLLLREEHSEK